MLACSLYRGSLTCVYLYFYEAVVLCAVHRIYCDFDRL